jgi:hypothetical protein
MFKSEVMSMVEVEKLFPEDLEKAYTIIDQLCEENDCAWYEAVEDFGGYELMEEAGIHDEVISAICYEI